MVFFPLSIPRNDVNVKIAAITSTTPTWTANVVSTPNTCFNAPVSRGTASPSVHPAAPMMQNTTEISISFPMIFLYLKSPIIHSQTVLIFMNETFLL